MPLTTACPYSPEISNDRYPGLSGVIFYRDIMTEFTFGAIGTVHCGGRYKFEAPRQGVFSSARAVIELKPEFSGETLRDLAGFDRIWVVFVFHCNLDAGWKAHVMPPYTPEQRKYSVFATRSPYSPNPIGMSCVKLEEIRDQRRLVISGHDLLDGTPVLDIKPYIPAADAFPEAAAGWHDELALPVWDLQFSEVFSVQADFLLRHGTPDMFNFCQVQLCHTPLDFSRRRVFPVGGDRYELGCRTWRIIFDIFPESMRIEIVSIRSNYTAAELLPGADDRYGDKEIHRKFLSAFVS